MSEAFLPTKSGAERKPVSTASDRDLAFWETRIGEKLADALAPYAKENRALLEAIRAERAKRASKSGSSNSSNDGVSTHRFGDVVVEIRVRQVGGDTE